MKAVEVATGFGAKVEFDLDDVYAQEATLAAPYPEDHSVRPKIRP